MLGWLATAAWAAPCVQSVPAAQVSARVEEALLSFAVLDQAAFEQAADESAAMAACVAEPLSPALAGGLHRVRGMRALLVGDAGAAGASFVAAVRADPAYTLPTTVAPAGGPLAESYAAAKTTQPPPTHPLELPDGVTGSVDGHPGAARPTIGPYWVQLQGRTLVTAWVVEGPPDAGLFPEPGAPGAGPAAGVAPLPGPMVAPLPAPAPAPTAALDLDLDPPTQRASGGGSPALLAVGVTSGVTAAALYGTAAAVRLGYDDAPTAGKYSTINTTYLASVGTGALSAALLGAWLATR